MESAKQHGRNEREELVAKWRSSGLSKAALYQGEPVSTCIAD